MKIFSANFEKEGPGIDKYQTPKRGFSLFIELLSLRFWDLLKLNIIFVIYCIPLVTIGPAVGAMTSITMSMIQRKHIYIFSDFHEAFKNNWKQSFITQFFYLIAIVTLNYSLIYYYNLSQSNLVFYFVFFICVFLSIFIGLSWLYVFPLIATVNLTLIDIFKNSILLTIVCFKDTLIVSIVYWIIVIINLIFFPFTFPLCLLLSFSTLSFIKCFITWKEIKTFIIK